MAPVAPHFVTREIAGVARNLPALRDPDGYIYFKEEVGGLVMGGFEPNATPWGMNGIPEPFEFQLLPDNWEAFEILMQNALLRVPALDTDPAKLASPRRRGPSVFRHNATGSPAARGRQN